MSALEKLLNELYMQFFGWMNPDIVDLLLIGMVALMFFLGLWMYCTWPEQCGLHIMGASGSLAVGDFIRMFAVERGATAGRVLMVVGCLGAMYFLLLARQSPDSRRLRKQLTGMAGAQFMVGLAFTTLYVMSRIVNKDGLLTHWLALRMSVAVLLLLATAATVANFIGAVVARATSRQP